MKKIKTNDLILLTGAGFTKNFGGFLASQMWDMIFNNPLIQSTPSLRTLLQTQQQYDFESAYTDVIEKKGFSQDEKNIMEQAIEDAYKMIDDATRQWVVSKTGPYPVNWYGVNDLFTLFNGNANERGLFFTVNQDLFMERRSGSVCPGVPRFREDFYNFHGKEFTKEYFVTLYKKEDTVKSIEKGFENHNGPLYIKLHGSYGWRSPEGLNHLVIGRNKKERIEQDPLLKYYFELFQNAIRDGNKKLLVIGYGFNDQEINLTLVDGVENHGLKIYIIDTRSPQDFRTHLQYGGHVYALPILEGLSGYYCHELKEIFPGTQEKTVHSERIIKALLA